MVEYVSAIYNSARVTKFSEFSIVKDTMDYFKFLYPKGTSAAHKTWSSAFTKLYSAWH